MEAEQVQEKKEEKTLTLKEVEKIVIELGEKGMSTENIGHILRDKHKVPKVKLLGKKINQILRENKIEPITDFQTLASTVETLDKHLAKHHQDYRTKRVASIKRAKLNKLALYLKKKQK